MIFGKNDKLLILPFPFPSLLFHFTPLLRTVTPLGWIIERKYRIPCLNPPIVKVIKDFISHSVQHGSVLLAVGIVHEPKRRTEHECSEL